jgi:two-component system, OmpR family, response regulator ChvI
LARHRILFVDDEKDITAVVKSGLERRGGLAVDTFNDPQKAAEEFQAGKYGLAILDIRMPNMTGFDLYRQLHKKDPDMRICFLTAYEIYRDEFKKMFPMIKVSCFVKKPIKVDDLAKIIEVELSVMPRA